MFPGVQAKHIDTLPNVNSFVDSPEAERAATKAEGPGIGITGMPLLTHNLACIIFPNDQCHHYGKIMKDAIR
mgnify:CR=1 FL=1